MLEKLHQWLPVADHTARMRVPGGWVYRTVEYNPGDDTVPASVAMVFVPGVYQPPDEDD